MAHVPIIGRPSNGEQIKAFRSRKMELKAAGYPHQETAALVKSLLSQSEDKWAGVITKDTVLISVPSGSGKNKVTALFASALAKRFGVGLLPAGHIMRQHRLEAKTNLSLEQRISDPVGYELYDKAATKEFCKGKKIVIVDDLIGSGESSVKLSKTLQKAGFEVAGLVNLVTVENRYPTLKDMARLVNKIASHRQMNENEKKNFWLDTAAVFADYTRQKLNRVERHITGELSAVGAYEVIKRAAVKEREFDKAIEGKDKQRNTQISIQ